MLSLLFGVIKRRAVLYLITQCLSIYIVTPLVDTKFSLLTHMQCIYTWSLNLELRLEQNSQACLFDHEILNRHCSSILSLYIQIGELQKKKLVELKLKIVN